MAHLLLLAYGPPEQHEKFRKLINKKKYMLKNKNRRGWYRPFASEIKLWNIHLPEEIIDDFVSDLSPRPGKNEKKHLGIFDKALRLFHKITPLKKVEEEKSKNPEIKNDLNGWYYTRVLGMLKDPRDERGNELL